MKQVTPSLDGRNSRWQRHRARRRTELITAARDAVAAHGAAISMEEIATACGTSKSVFYRYFTDKAGVQAAVGEYFVNRMRRRMVAAASEADTFAATVHALVSEYLRSVAGSGEVYRFVVTAPDEQGSAVEGFVDSVRQLLVEQHGRHHGEQDLPPGVLQCWAAATVGMVRGAGEAWLAQGDLPGRPDRHAMSRTITTWAVEGLRPVASTAPPGPPGTGAPSLPDHT
ncbi:TetR/AcrR family transcriptional regulator [Kocuria sp.]|uniref:TetR/AcrR family transcriptional regulator n=1 Tax=Kocuria sp. TaxID=1871328 RepID=UPI0026DA89C5|nr:TetR/AcrR family transcriptional regulator [Kocuria sp.]MDO4920002.1 TetR/AcrR family transcriptional regulator [Kocuria sp.]